MATYRNNNYNYYQDNTVTEGKQTNTTSVGARNDSGTSNVSTNKKGDAALDTAYDQLGQRVTSVSQLDNVNENQLDPNRLLSLYNQAAKTQYDVGNTEYEQAFNEYGRGLNSAQDSYIAAMRQANANAIASGAARGTQAANELSTILGLQQQSAAGATDLANQRAQLGLDYAKALSEAQVNAEAEAWNRGKSLEELIGQYYAAPRYEAVGSIGYNTAGAYIGNNTNTATTAKTGKQTTTETTGKKTTKTDYK